MLLYPFFLPAVGITYVSQGRLLEVPSTDLLQPI